MRILSAMDAVSPAMERTKLVLFTPFRKGRTWKLAITAYLGLASMNFMPLFLVALFFLGPIKREGGMTIAVVVAVAVLLMTVIGVILFHLCTRLQFCAFDIVLNRGEFVKPAWRKYGPQARRWSLFKIALGTAETAVISLPIIAYIYHIIPIIQDLRPGQEPPQEFMLALMGGYGMVALCFLCISMVGMVLNDFLVPSLALENVTFGEAFRRLTQLIRKETGQFFAHFFLKLLMAMAGYMAVSFAFQIVFVLTAAIIGLVCLVIGILLHLVGVPTVALIVLAAIIGVAYYLFVFGYLMLLGMGSVVTFLKAYTLYFLGGRYPMLGELLEKSTPPPPPPAYWPPEFTQPNPVP